MRSLYVVPLVLAAAVAGTAIAGKHGKQVRYLGIHPIPKSAGGGLCYIEGPHVHVFAANKLEYRDHRGASVFVGDPVAYGYDGPTHVFEGHHPIHVEDDTEWCYLDGPHYHAFAAPEGPEFEIKGDVAFYVAEPPPVYVEARPALVKINAVYTPLVYERPVVTVEPPSAWIGVRFAAPVSAVVVDERPPAVVVPGRVRAGAGVRVRAGVEVVVPPPPRLEVNVGVGIGFGGGVRVKGDNGRHRGWGKKGRRH